MINTLQSVDASSAGICCSGSCEIQEANATDRVICRCLKVTESEIQTAISAFNIQTVRELGRCTGAGKGCMSCHGRLKALVLSRQS